MKTFLSQSKTSYSIEEREEIIGGQNFSFFDFLFTAFFDSSKSVVNFKQYDNMKILIIEDTVDEHKGVFEHEPEFYKKPSDVKPSHFVENRKSKQRNLSKFTFLKKMRKKPKK